MNVGVGSYSLMARVTFDTGSASAGTADSSPIGISVVSNTPVAITVNAVNDPPIASPQARGLATWRTPVSLPGNRHRVAMAMRRASPNKGLQPTPYSLCSFVASASRRG
jgi:hypothetical protein